MFAIAIPNHHMTKYAFFLFFFWSVVAKAQEYPCNDQWFEGEGTHYGGGGGGAGGHCGIPVATGDIYHAALNHAQYAGSVACGACVRILGPKGTVVLKIVDECPECKFGDIDMTTAVFPQLAQMKDGRIKIKWQYVPCSEMTDIKVFFDAGSSPYYFKAQFRDFLYPLAKVEYKKQDGSYDTLHREVYNYFVRQGGIDEDKAKAGPYTFRLTPLVGHPIEIINVPLQTEQPFSTGQQFDSIPCPDCAGEKGGNAYVDNCGVCSGGNTPITPNSTCQKDCNDYWEGTAYIDSCGNCVAGTTGATPCQDDCNGQAGGMAYLDKCGNCVGGTTGMAACNKDCHNDWGGTAFVDSCGKCAGGNTGQLPQLVKEQCLASSLTPKAAHFADLQIFPNPFEAEIHVNAQQGAVLRLADLQGKLVWQATKTSQSILTPSLLPGIYLLSVYQQGYVKTFKLEKR